MKLNKRIRAAEEVAPETVPVDVAPEATDLLFEAEDVAELVAEVTGEAVEVAVDEGSVTFNVGDAEYTVEAEGDEEYVEASRRAPRTAKPVAASKKPAVKASTRVFRKVPAKR